jgi:hypothetical protein|tara:strand:+ start:1031 stop:1240 length:210 start_codon:yes stop_codon:yes gene_type:complete
MELLMPRTTVNQVASQIETHEQVCGERWKNAYERFDRIEALMEAHSQRLWWIAGIIISLLLPIAYSSLF